MKKTIVKDTVFMLAGGVLYAAATCVFIFPSSVILGGTSGISVILEHFLPLSAGSILTVINVLLMILAFIILGRNSAAKTFIGSIVTTAAIAVMDMFFSAVRPNLNIYASAVIGSSLIAIATAMLMYVDSSSGGTDIIALIIKKFSSLNIGMSLLVTDVLIVIAGGILSGLHVAISSVIGLVIKALGVNLFLAIIKRAEKAITHFAFCDKKFKKSER